MALIYRRLVWQALILVLGTLAEFESPAAWAVSSYNGVTITQLIVFQGGVPNPGTVILFSPTTADTEGCTQSGKGYAFIDWSSTVQPDGKALYATVLAAEIAGKTITISVNGCSQGYYPLVYAIAVNP